MYDNKTFEEFLTVVLSRADQLSIDRRGRSLSERFDAPTTVTKMIGAILDTGWNNFLELHKILSRNSYFGFIGSWGSFLGMAIGASVSNALVYWGGKDSIKVLYNNRDIVDAVKTIGDKFYRRYNGCHSQEEYESLANEAAEELCNL